MGGNLQRQFIGFTGGILIGVLAVLAALCLALPINSRVALGLAGMGLLVGSEVCLEQLKTKYRLTTAAAVRQALRRPDHLTN
ncbi:hypothetical protein [Lactiplantibacillus plajomi]|uniref:Integral membrane protein n=1 Tax=Lactiplantibacillus plajomi TaxID=1457217 RepID=A0ABV6K0J7_9LACO|nr:hypothetical protein [Lactiplantibacillus plajomi]